MINDIKLISLRIIDENTVKICAPYNTDREVIEKFVVKHEKWIEKQIIKKHEHDEKFALSSEEEIMLKEKALPYLTERTEYFAKLMGLKYSGIKITSAKKRFGSCSGKNTFG